MKEYDLDEGRKVKVMFEDLGDSTRVTETFDVEDIHSLEQQQAGRQAILENFKKHVETK